MYDLDEILREKIGECGLLGPDAITTKFFKCGVPFQLMKYDGDIDFDGKIYRIVWIEKWTYDTDDTEAVNVAETMFFDKWEI